ncbi:MAG: acyl-CoA dehydratase activase-related protein, partial [Bacillota bacterium]|nr:acyl-CoA dehydratase activase-related protein [Bacillota bacterium]
MSNQVAIGLPRALLYYEYGAAWEEFLRILGAVPLLSGPTTRAKIEAGLCEALDEACLPVKVAYGHCLHLAEQVDRIFVPRVVSTEPRAYSCPKLLGLPDMIRLAVPGPVSILSPLIDLSRGRAGSLQRAAEQVGAVTGAGRAAIGRAARALAWGTCAENLCARARCTGRREPETTPGGGSGG